MDWARLVSLSPHLLAVWRGMRRVRSYGAERILPNRNCRYNQAEYIGQDTRTVNVDDSIGQQIK